MTEPTVRFTKTFGRNLKRLRKLYPNVEGDVWRLVRVLKQGGTPGELLRSDFHARLYQWELASSDTGSGFRVLYFTHHETEYTLLMIYSKMERDRLPQDEVINEFGSLAMALYDEESGGLYDIP